MEEGWWNQFLTTCFFQNHQDESQVLKVWVSNAHCPRAAGIHGFFLLWNRPLAILWCIWSASTDFGQTNVTIAPYIALVLDIYTTPTKTDTIMTTPLEWTSVTWFATWDNTVDGFTIPYYWEMIGTVFLIDNHHKEWSNLLGKTQRKTARKSRWPLWPPALWVEVSVEVTLGSEFLSYHINVTQKCWEWTEKLGCFWLVKIIYIYIHMFHCTPIMKCSHGGEKE